MKCMGIIACDALLATLMPSGAVSGCCRDCKDVKNAFQKVRMQLTLSAIQR